jgi:uncharacterized protein YdeI (YjbR/CyaY-like superfamily)
VHRREHSTPARTAKLIGVTVRRPPMVVGSGDTGPMIGTPGGSADRPALFFSGPAEFRRWLEANHQSATELWMGLHKKHVPDRGLQWAEAVEEALCFGWIDSVAQRIDDDSRRQRWTPRKKSSNWSTINIGLVAKLIEQKRMRPAGLAAFELRRPERSGIYAYENSGSTTFPPEFAELLQADPIASAWFAAAPASYRKIVVNWVVSAKREATKAGRMAEFIADSAAGRLIKSQRYGDQPAWVARLRTELGVPHSR